MTDDQQPKQTPPKSAGHPKGTRIRTEGDPEFVVLFEKVQAADRKDRSAIVKAYALEHNMKVNSLTVRISQHRRRVAERLMKQAKDTRQVYTNTADAERMTKSTDDMLTKADSIMRELIETARVEKASGKDPWASIAIRNDARNMADMIYKRLGVVGGPSQTVVNIANVIKTNPPETWVKDDWKAVFAAMTNNEVAKNEMREFARQWWGWKVDG